MTVLAAFGRGLQRPRLSSTARVWPINGALAILTVALLAGLPHGVPPGIRLHVAWWVLIPAFWFTTTFGLDFEFRQQARTMYLDQLCLLIGLYFCSPVGLIAAGTLGRALALVPRRQDPAKFVVNLLSVATPTALAELIFRALWPTGHWTGAITWPAAFASVLTFQLAAYCSIRVAIAAVERRWRWQEFLEPIPLDIFTVLVVTCLALVGVASLAYDPETGIVLALCVGLCLVAFRAYNQVAARHRALERLYAFARVLGPVVADPADLGPTLSELRLLLHADRLELALLAGDDPATVFAVGNGGDTLEVSAWDAAHLRASTRAILESSRTSLLDRPHSRPWDSRPAGSEDRMVARLGASDPPVGLLLAEHRSGPVRGFDHNDLRLLEAIASQLGTALEKGRLLETLRRAATSDRLTGLPNLESLRTHLGEQLAVQDGERGVVVLFMDLDRFQDVNNTLGHDAGDALLIETARRLREATPTGGLCARVGGDKFAIALPGSAGSEVARLAALAIKSRIEGPVRFGELSADIRLTIGMSRAPQHGSDAIALLRRAEMAMSAAKGTTGGIAEWEADQERDGARRLHVLGGLRSALANSELEVSYQPKLRLGSGEVVGVEALARWRHSELGWISPLEFVPLAEASGLIGALTTNVLRAALTTCRSWHDRGLRIGVAVNLSARSLTDPVIVGQVAALLTATSLDPRWLTLEITESSVMENPAQSIDVLHQLRSLGVRLAIDDFGTGYSSLTYVRGLPVHEVKVDKAFIDNVANDRADRAVVRAIVELAHSLGLTTVAEGVESADQALALETLQIDEVQGFFYAKPMPAETATDWLMLRRPSARR
ncbi:MAG TPA: bifunctional diguanylate cyclase/phosphodiesterase [Mycobacteriales bacterium]|nr:bifunctional diguanylate cyclase/phosphodiesterase [Mycobacteriales bacterium]